MKIADTRWFRRLSGHGAGRSELPLLGALLAFCGACSDQSVEVDLRSLQASGDVTYVCRDSNQRAVPLSECNPGSIAPGERNLLALVTQTSTGEIAVINLPLDPDSKGADEGVVDIDPSTPGYGFLRVGAQPGDIVSTPGGEASFVAVGEPGKPGVFGLPSSCLSAPAENEPARDLTSWPACALPSLPGELAVVIDPPNSEGAIFEACDRASGPEASPVEQSTRVQCKADLTQEAGPRGRRKLLVALPDRGSVAVIDAQWLLNRASGSFEACQIEAEFSLSVDLPVGPAPQEIPEDLRSGMPAATPQPPAPPTYSARPAGFALSEDLLYIADEAAPVVHVLNVSRPCSIVETPPLLPTSFDAPTRVVKTSRVAVSPLTPRGRRFVYATEFEGPGAGLIAFDVSPRSSQRTPIVRPGAPYLPFEAPDRIQFGAAVRDVSFILRDRPEFDPETGAAALGEQCDPNPGSSSLGVEYRPNAEYTAGARPFKLRGVFAVVLLTNGQLAFVDVEDFDAPCRRPVSGNPGSVADFRGCQNDALSSYEESGTATVTNEVSCQVVQPHRARAALLAITSSSQGVRAPSLGSFPQLKVTDEDAQSSFAQRPKLLGVDFEGSGAATEAARVFVGTTEFARDGAEPAAESELVIDPALAEQYSVVLPFNEPRAYPSADELRLEYEGIVTDTQPGGLFQPSAADEGAMTLEDPGANYCDRGVNDPALLREVGSERFDLSGDALTSFATEYADYVLITADFPDEEKSTYWSDPDGECSYSSCEDLFGAFDEERLLPTREFRIVDAEQEKLRIEPRSVSAEVSRDPVLEQERLDRRTDLVEEANCCFPGGTQYVVKASQQWVLRGSATGFRHDIVARRVTDADGQSRIDCVRDSNPRKRYFDSRVFEVGDSMCTLDGRDTIVSLEKPAARCIHQTPTARFAVYRGELPSTPGMAFLWRTVGGFSPLALNLATISSAVSPRSMVGLPDMDWLTVVDAASLGLTLVGLDDVSILTPPLN